MASLAGLGGVAKGGFQVVQVAGFGGGHQLGHLGVVLVQPLFHLVLLFPQCRFGVAAFGAGAKADPGQLVGVFQNGGVFCGQLGIKSHLALGHGAQGAKVVTHHGLGALAVFDGVFRLGKLRRSRHRQGGGTCGQNKGEQSFHQGTSFLGGQRNYSCASIAAACGGATSLPEAGCAQSHTARLRPAPAMKVLP